MRNLAQQQALTQAELGRRTGMAQATVSRAFTGQTVTVEHLVALCRALGVTPEEIFRQADTRR